VSGHERQGRRSPQHEEGEASGAQLDLQEVTRVRAGDVQGDRVQPLPDLAVREIYADDTESDDRPSSRTALPRRQHANATVHAGSGGSIDQ
jgi:hypothetical protein